MPLVRIDLAATTPPPLRRGIADAVHRALVDIVGIPDGDRFQIVRAHEPDELIFDPEYLGIERRDVVYIQITLVRGRPDERKQRLHRRIADNLVALGLRAEDVFVVLTENSPVDWSAGNGEAQLLSLGALPGTGD